MNNTFGKRVEQLLLVNNIKNATVAAALNYDVSYISKWITGKAVPSKKNLERVIGTIAELVLRHASAENLQMLFSSFGVKTDAALKTAIIDMLRDAYYETTGEVNEILYANNAALRAAPRGNYPLLADYRSDLSSHDAVHLIVMMDLFSMDQVSKLHMAGIEGYHFKIQDKRENVKLDYIIDLNALDGRSVYDMILLIHMMTSFSKAEYQLYYSPWAAGKLMIAAKDAFAGITLIGKDKQFLCTTSTKEKKTVSDIYESLCEYMDPDKVLFRQTTMEHLLMHHEYLHSLISKDARWVIGHLTEHFLPRDLFEKYNQLCFENDKEKLLETERAYLLAIRMMEKGEVDALVYNNAFVDFMLTGEIDFFNEKIILTADERKKVLQHLLAFESSMKAGCVKMVKEGFSDDFKYITNPCFFLSSSVGYLRLENELYEKNILLLQDEGIRSKFDAFFEKIWEESRDNVISNNETIIEKISNLIETADVLV